MELVRLNWNYYRIPKEARNDDDADADADAVRAEWMKESKKVFVYDQRNWFVSIV